MLRLGPALIGCRPVLIEACNPCCARNWGFRYCFLLPAAIVLCQMKGAGSVFKAVIELDSDTKDDSFLEGGTPKQIQTGKYKEALKVTSGDGTHILVFRSTAAKSQWLHAIRNNISCTATSTLF